MPTCARSHCSEIAESGKTRCLYDDMYIFLKYKIRHCKNGKQRDRLKAQRDEMKRIGKRAYNQQRSGQANDAPATTAAAGVMVEERHAVRATESVQVSTTDRKMLETVMKTVERRIEENSDGKKITFEQEQSQMIRQTDEEILEMKRTRSLECVVSRKVELWKQQFMSTKARVYFQQEFKYRKKRLQQLPQKGFYLYSDRALADALPLFKRDWDRVNDALDAKVPINDVSPAMIRDRPFDVLKKLQQRRSIIQFMYPHLGAVFEYMVKQVVSAYKNFLTDKKKIRQQCTGAFSPEMLKLCDPLKFSEEYIRTTYRQQWELKANQVTTALHEVGISDNSAGSKEAFNKLMHGMAPWTEILAARRNLAKRSPFYRSATNLKKYKLTLGFSPRQLEMLSQQSEPCLRDRIATVVEFQQRKYGKMRELVSTIHSFQRLMCHGSAAAPPPEMKSWQVESVDEMQNVGFGSNLWVQSFCGQPREWTHSTRQKEGLSAWAVCRVSRNVGGDGDGDGDEDDEEFVVTLPGSYLNHVFGGRGDQTFASLLESPITHAVKQMLGGTEYGPKVIYQIMGQKALGMGQNLIQQPEFEWARKQARALEYGIQESSRREYADSKTAQQWELEARACQDAARQSQTDQRQFEREKLITLAQLKQCTI